MFSPFILAAQLAVVNAPADQYFGRLKMSTLRIRYETMQLRRRYEGHELLPEQAEHLALLTQDAFDQWSRAYPRDAWLPSTGFLMAQFYAELPGTVARTHAVNLYVYVKSLFPSTSYAASSRAALHRGVPVKPDPAWAKAMRAATPSPSPVPSVSPAASPPTSPSSSTPPSSAPSPTGSPAAGRQSRAGSRGQ